MPAIARRATLLLCLSFAAAVQAAAPLIVDGDADGVSDEIDDCPYTQPGIRVDAKGCPRRRDDGDLDGVTDEEDDCPYTTPGAVIDLRGCALDGDFDGVADGLDRCPRSPLARPVNAQGCATGEQPSIAVAAAQPKKTLSRAAMPSPAASHMEAGEAPRLVVPFTRGSVRLGSRDDAAIESYARFFGRRLAADARLKLVIRASAEAGEPQATTLAMARLVAVRQVLQQRGIAADRIQSEHRTQGQRRVEVELSQR